MIICVCVFNLFMENTVKFKDSNISTCSLSGLSISYLSETRLRKKTQGSKQVLNSLLFLGLSCIMNYLDSVHIFKGYHFSAVFY